MCTINENHMICFLKYKVQQTEFFVILDHFLSFHPPPDNPENQNFEKMKKGHVHKYEAVYSFFLWTFEMLLHFEQLFSSNLQSGDKLSTDHK